VCEHFSSCWAISIGEIGYDANGNRLTQTGTSASSYAIAATSNRLTATTGALVRTHTYDTAGNTLTTGATIHTYNNRGRMKTGRLSSTSTNTSYVYNALGQRVKKSGGTPGTVIFAYDEAGHLIGEYSATGTLVQETIWLGDIPIATLRPKTGGYDIFYVHTDHLNTPRRVTRPSDNKLRWRWDPTPFGEGAPNENPQALGVFKYNLRFPGQYFDIETNLAYNYFRDYDSAIGRYVESDPIGLAGGVNTYAYVLGNPIGLTDPTGLQASDLRTPSAAQIREMSQRSCARQAFLRNYEAMRAANWKRSDKYFHCKANCEAARCGPAGYDEACVVSNVREATDKAFGDPPSASAADQAANQYGRDVAAKSASITCQVGCSRYRPPGLPAQY